MPALKRSRSRSVIEKTNAKPTKRSKVEKILPPSDPLVAVNARIVDLEQQVRDLHAFINAKGLTRSKSANYRVLLSPDIDAALGVPESIRQHMNQQPDAAKMVAGQIQAAARQVSRRLSSEVLNSRSTGVSSDDMSAAMMEFLDEVEGLRKLPNSTAIAFVLVMALGRFTYGDLGSSDPCASGYDERPSDEVVDDLLVELAEERRQVEPTWDYKKDLETLRERAENVSKYGIKDFCSATIALLGEWNDAS